MSIAPGWRRLFRLPRGVGRSLEREVDDELAFHLAMREEKLRRLGLADDAARAAAAARFGDASKVRDECLTIDRQYAREMELMEWLASIWSDLRYAWRTLRRAPAFTAVATLTLALGVGATSAVFSLVNGILLRPLPYPDPGRLVRVIQSYPEKGLDTWTLSQANVAMYGERQHVFTAFAAWTVRIATLTGLDHPETIRITKVTRDYFRVLGVGPVLGRDFTTEEDTPTGAHVAVLSYGFWQRHYAGSTDAIGKTISLDGYPTRIVGVMPPNTSFDGFDSQLWIPLGLDRNQKWGWFLWGVARLKPGVSAAQAQRELTDILWAMGREDPNLVSRTDPPPAGAGLKALVTPLRQTVIGGSTRPLIVLQVAVLLILLIAGANVATLLLSRGAGRTPEIALRMAMGATGSRIIRQLLTESVALSLLGALAGVALAVLGVRALPHLPISSLPRASEVRVDGTVLGFALIVAVLTGLAFGLVPALHVRRATLGANLAGSRRGGTSSSARRTNGILIVAQLALSIVLLIGAGLTLKSMHRLMTLDFGFRPDGVTTVSLPLPHMKYMGPNGGARIAAFTNVLVERVRAVPGVRAAAVAWGPPFWGTGSDGYRIEGHQSAAAGGDEPQTITAAVSPGFFSTLEIPLRRGRDFGSMDRDSSLLVAIVDETLAHRFWADGDAVGHRIQMTGDTAWRTIVGVVGAVRDGNPADPPVPHTYYPYTQQPSRFVNLEVRTAGVPNQTLRAVLHTIATLEPEIPLDYSQPLTATIGNTVADRRLTELLLGAFAVLALLLAAIGIYGVMSLFVSHRTREFGIRLAIGAQPGSIVRLVLREGLILALVGVVAGVGGAFLLTRWMRKLLYEVSTTDPTVFMLFPVILIAVAVAACYAPSRRAAKSDPLAALRAE